MEMLGGRYTRETELSRGRERICAGGGEQDPRWSDSGRAGAALPFGCRRLVGLGLVEEQDEDEADHAEHTHDEHRQAKRCHGGAPFSKMIAI